ncbi:MAG: tail fiber domain-containing protein, partial [Candidatus Magnetominusculus sp. LBB02]|nr:tail fiber domain-containing protein [Candidatus Magnetominusculus sp. LBB02]
GSWNVGVGMNAGGTYGITGNYNTYLGGAATATADGYSNSTAVGYGATVTGSNYMQLGNSSVTKVYSYGTWTASSDVNLKTSVANIPYDGGRAVDQITPIFYQWKSDIDTVGLDNATMHAGFTAQNLDNLPYIVDTGNEYLSIDPIGILAYGVLELKALRQRVLVIEGKTSDVSDNNSVVSINGGLQLNPTSAKPACDNAHRGTHWFTAAPDNSTDYEEVCAYANGVLAWRRVTWQ